jgi:hypothetical protein
MLTDSIYKCVGTNQVIFGVEKSRRAMSLFAESQVACDEMAAVVCLDLNAFYRGCICSHLKFSDKVIVWHLPLFTVPNR